MTTEQLLNMPETIKRIENYGDDDMNKQKIEKDLAKNKNYIIGIFYHATGGYGETGVGKGLYLGKDKFALENFYNSDGTEGSIIKYYGFPNFIDLTDYSEFDEYEAIAIKHFGQKDALKQMTLELGYDGIRYYDPIATGEEFVLYNTDKVEIV